MNQPQWRIESMDARAGLAFASWRVERPQKWDGLPEEGQMIFVGAPDFQPEPVGNLSLSLGAARASFQEGLYVGDSEVSFPNPESLASFVRRVYAASGGGDGNDSGTAPMPPAPSPDSPPTSFDFPNINRGEQWTGVRDSYLRLVNSVPAGHSKSTASLWPQELKGPVPDMLANGGLLILLELLRRAPNSTGGELLGWLRLTRSFSTVLSSLGLWPLLLSRQNWLVLQNAVRNLPLTWPQPPATQLDVETRAALLFFGGPAIDDAEGTERFQDAWEFWPTPMFAAWSSPFFSLRADSFDPLTLLAELPLPEPLRALAADGHYPRSSVYHALSVFIGSPVVMALKHLDYNASLDVLLLAAACITSTTHSSPWHYTPFGGHGLRHMKVNSPTPLQLAAITEAANLGWAWLREQLPADVFPHDLELLILKARDLGYKSA